ncbi:Ig-like domain-containing protein [Methanomethylovorans hollandica DSM 15978]|uniref:Ig-like domain-containing protein n=1 Tax=Methanomethylovorans hollandica (strain DSM 15978 / NBRC 107637 / DMS1) TaxID=867904 RepID=L0L154_METHD|nr:disaggregatase related repeat-containing protein [Methanomethylovorans hollandica]AGB49999.1 Ig-like domain-containing protein [Methanomethylovorans hollandica DSM 15978]
MEYQEKKDRSQKNIFKLSGVLFLLIILSVGIVAADRIEDVKSDKSAPIYNSFTIYSTGIATSDLNASLTPTDLVNSLLGGGVSVSNVTFTGNNRASGLFSGGNGIIGFDSGVILGTGDINNVIGPNKYNSTGTNYSLPGDDVLDGLIPSYNTYDAAILEFDFVPNTSQMTFNYVFGSEEYNEYANTEYNDVFGFFVNGNTTDFNIALLPGITPPTPVSINSVNGGYPLGTDPKNPEFYINNVLPNATINTELDGLTVVLTAIANVKPGELNHIKLAIGDAGDPYLDSYVFIQAGSVMSLKLSLTPLNTTNEVGTSHTLTSRLVNTNNEPISGKTITFTVSGPNAQNGTAVTDSNGNATWSYIGSNAGTDTIVAINDEETSNPISTAWVQVDHEVSIDIEKYVWNGTDWEDTDSAPGPSLSFDPVKFKIVVNNNGNVTLTGVNVTDDKYGPVLLNNTTLDPNASTAAEYNVSISPGQQINNATASGYYNGTEYTDQDSAYYVGTNANVHTAINDNNLRESSSCSVLGTTTYLDVGNNESRARDVMLFDLSMYDKNDTISRATLSLFWYYPESKTRTSDTVVEVYRPAQWNPEHVTWYYYDYHRAWQPVGGAWFDVNNIAQGNVPYASVTFPASTVPDNQYHDFDVTQLVQEYISGTYENTGFFLKASTESGNYIAFYSSEWSNPDQRPKLTVEL